MDFEKDIFISYAHNDNVSINGDGSGWVTDFQHSLKTRLTQLSGKVISVWFDDRSDNDIFAPEIEAQFQKLRIMICITTPRYIKSEWSRHEIDSFIISSGLNGGLAFDDKSRIMKILKGLVPIGCQTESLRFN
ncbi:MAG TPA: TIR domain-containing protein [Panacibacter sp.]|nr:TIR domain-containing protein [Panacibacter sp.]